MNINLLRIKIDTLKNEASEKDQTIINRLETACNNLSDKKLDKNSAIIYSNIHVRFNLMLVDYNLV